jgi:intracellular multiplication protein IcmS
LSDPTSIVTQVAKVAHSLCGRYLLKGNVISAEEAFSEIALLPSIMRRADQLCSFCLGYGLGVTFEKSDEGTLGVRVVFDSKTSHALRLLCVTDVLIEVIQKSSNPAEVSLDDLLQD